VRGGVAAIGAIAALINMAPPAVPGWVLPAVAVNCAWAAIFTWTVLRNGMRSWLMAVDVVLVAVFAVVQRYLVAPGALPDGGGWVATLCSMTLINAHLVWRPRAAVPAGVVILVSYLIGADIAGTPDGGVPQTIAFAVQTITTAVLTTLLRRASRFADDAIARYHRAQQEAYVHQVVRAVEREQNRALHDKVLGVLTPVGTGDISTTSKSLRGGAAVALHVITGLGDAEQQGEGAVQLDDLLGKLVASAAPRLRVRQDLRPCVVPAQVALAFAGAVGAALDNVRLHAGTTTAEVTLTASNRRITATVRDDGRGFVPAAVPAHKYGLRESVRARMAAVGGGADISSTPGDGTVVSLWWQPDD
jgi:hypothetical protein